MNVAAIFATFVATIAKPKLETERDILARQLRQARRNKQFQRVHYLERRPCEVTTTEIRKFVEQCHAASE